jgi:hypothetical protein
MRDKKIIANNRRNNMNDIDFIKWMCEKAGWRIAVNNKGDFFIYVSDVVYFGVDLIGAHEAVDIVYMPLLLQRAFWGCDEISSMQISLTGQFCFQLRHHPMNITHCFSTEDECYESALKYIYEQTK